MEDERIDYLYKYFEIKKGTEHSQIDLILEMAKQFDVPGFAGVKAKSAYETTFEELWKECPKPSRRGGRHRPLQIWRRLTLQERKAALKVVRLWAAYEEKKDDPSLVPHLATWLNQKRWEAFEEALNGGNN